MNVSRRRIFVPEVVQTSAMDCGPAALKCLAEGFGIPVSYGRLREACQTDVDGTSIDTMEEVAKQLGLDAEQVIVPADFVLLPEADLLPAIAVVLRASKVTHFVVAWRNRGGLVQVMDPAVGRQWVPKAQFVSSLYIHTLPVPAAGFREWAESEKLTLPLRRHLDDLGISPKSAARFVDTALTAPGWRALARLEAGTRSLGAIVRSGGLRRGAEAARVLTRLLEQAGQDSQEGHGVIPSNYWSAWPAPSEGGEERVFFKGAVLVRVNGRRSESAIAEAGKLPPEVAAALQEKTSRPAMELLRMLKTEGLGAPVAAVAALGLATLGVLIEAILFRSLLDMPREFGLSGQRLGVMTALLLFLTALMLLELPIASGLLRIGRHLEARLRIAFLKKIPKLGDRYFHSRLTSDMAERSHSTHRLRLLPGLGGQLLRSVFELIVTVAGIIWLDPQLAVPALIAAALAVSLPLMMQPMFTERDLRMRSQTGALSRFYLDALLGLVPVLTHRAERSLRREHESLLVEWAHAAFALLRVILCVEALQLLTGYGLGAWLMLNHIGRAGEAGGALLLVYWALNLPGLGEEIVQVARQYPSYRSVTLRLLEPLGALEEESTAPESPGETSREEASSESVANESKTTHQTRVHQSLDRSHGVAIELANVNVRAAGHAILEEINLKFEPGDHVAIVGPSGAGKSSLLGLLLGWYRPAQGSVVVDGAALEGARLDRLRERTAWVDPAVHLWNRSLFSNLCYGNPDAVPTAALLEQSNLRQLLEKLPDGLQTDLGESGGLVSGGEGQRVRLGRALLKRGVRLALLDEPFRGLDRHQRRELLARARRHWDYTTLLCVTHDVGETMGFPRVLVIENGRIVEDGNPEDLVRQTNSRYRALLEAEESVREASWSSGDWRHLRMEDGRLTEELQRAGMKEEPV